jgi:hypothetical protein
MIVQVLEGVSVRYPSFGVRDKEKKEEKTTPKQFTAFAEKRKKKIFRKKKM